MAGFQNSAESRRELEARVLAAALKQSFERGDMPGALLAHRQLTDLLRLKSGAADKAKSAPVEPKQKSEAKETGRARVQAGREADAEPAPVVAAEPAPVVSAEAAPAISAEASDGPEPVEERVEVSPAGPVMEKQAVEETPPPEPVKGPPAVDAGKNGEAAVPPDEKGFATFYDILMVNSMSSFESIHVSFLRLVRTLVRAQTERKELPAREFRDRLRTICVAHDVLKDPGTRTDYDFRLMGLRGEGGNTAVTTPDEMRPAGHPNRTPLRIGELLQCSQILDPAELEIAVDMHKAMPEMPFGQFLVKQGFLSEDELHSALLGQRLIVDGKITVAQFQVAMYGMRESATPVAETLLLRGWVRDFDIENVVLPDPMAMRAATVETATAASPSSIKDVPVQPKDPDANRIQKITSTNAVPSWAQQIDWEGEEPPAAEAIAGDAAAEAVVGDAAAEPAEPAEAAEARELVPAPDDATAGDDVPAESESQPAAEVLSEGELELLDKAMSFFDDGEGDEPPAIASGAAGLDDVELDLEPQLAGPEPESAELEPEEEPEEEPGDESTEGPGDEPGDEVNCQPEGGLEDAPTPEAALPVEETPRPSPRASGGSAKARDISRDPVVLSLQEQLSGLKSRRQSIQKEAASEKAETPAADGMTDLDPVVGDIEDEGADDGRDAGDDRADRMALEPRLETFTGSVEEEQSPPSGKGL